MDDNTKRLVSVLREIARKKRDDGMEISPQHQYALDLAELTEDGEYEASHRGHWPEDFAHENGNYDNKCCHCGRIFRGHKRRVTCKVCAAAGEGAGA